MLRIAYLFERFPSFGQTFCYREVAELIRQGADVTILSIRRPMGEPAQDWEAVITSRVIYLPDETELVKEVDRAVRGGELPNAAVRSLKEWNRQTDFLRLFQAVHVGLKLRKAGIQRLHAHFAGMAARTAYWIRQFFGIDYSLTAHANDIFASHDFVVSLKKIFEAATTIVTVSDFALRDLTTRFPQDAAKIHRVYNGLNLGQFRPAEFSTSPPLILSVGRLIDKKGFADLISACERLKAGQTNFRCEIIGEGPLENDLRAQIAGAQLGDRVKMVGPRTQNEIAGRLAAATIFVLASRPGADGEMDNLPTVIMEAMAAGLPVVSTPIAGIPEMVQPGVNGELVPAGDPVALAAAIQTLIWNPAKARELGARGRVLAAEKFSVETNVKTLATLLATP